MMVSSILFILLLTVSCGRDSSPTNSTEQQDEIISFSIVYATGDSAVRQGIAKVIGDFERSHPNIQINQENEMNSNSGNYLDYLKTKDAVGEFPDLVEIRDTSMFVNAGLITELPSDITALFPDAPTINGESYNAPMSLPQPLGIIYSKKLFREAGISDIPQTYKEFLEACKAIEQIGKQPLVVGGKNLWHMGFWITKFMIDEVYMDNPNWNAKRTLKEVSFTDPAPMKAMSQLKELWLQGFVTPEFQNIADNQTASYLTSGKAAMLYSGSWMFEQLKKEDSSFEYGFFALPDEQGVVNILAKPYPAGWSISTEAAADERKYKAIKQFLHFFFSPDVYPRYLSPAGAIPTTGDHLQFNMSEQMTEVMRLVKDPLVGKSLGFGNSWGENELPGGFRDWFYLRMEDVVTGKITLEAAMAAADQFWDQEAAEQQGQP